jgi:ribosome-binding protein aMBF1 (putative translation factor)
MAIHPSRSLKVDELVRGGMHISEAILVATYGEDYKELTIDERLERLLDAEDPGRRKRITLSPITPPQQDEIHLCIGRRLREARVGGMLSQKALARAAGMSQASVSRIERGSRSPTYSEVSRFAMLLDKKPEDFARAYEQA